MAIDIIVDFLGRGIWNVSFMEFGEDGEYVGNACIDSREFALKKEAVSFARSIRRGLKDDNVSVSILVDGEALSDVRA